MEKNKYQKFYTEAQLSDCIEIPISYVTNELRKYVSFKGLLNRGNVDSKKMERFYVDGYIIITETHSEQIGEDEYEDLLIQGTCSQYCPVPGKKYSHETFSVATRFVIKEALINYGEFKAALSKLGIPLINEANNVQPKDFNYDTNLVNRKSNFTLDDAANIAANIYSTNKYESISQFPNPLKDHYLELLSDCIKGSNQDNFKLHTVELWCSYHDEFGESYSKTYDNGTYLKQKAVLDYQLTIISKREFLRWCEYENIDTGLTYELKLFEESIEALKAENEKFKTHIRPQGFQQAPPAKPDNKNSEKIELLNREIEQLTEEVDLLKDNSFPIMTTKLKAALKAQNEYWLSYDEKDPPLQKTVKYFIEKELGLNHSKENRGAAELTGAIQPDEIKRK